MNPHDFHLRERVPESDKKAADHTVELLTMLLHFINDIGTAFNLFNTIQGQIHNAFASGNAGPPTPPALKEWSRWRFVPARDVAVNIYNFSQCIEAISSYVHRNPGLKAIVDTDQLTRAKRQFQKEFHFRSDLRHAVAHAAEMHKTPEVVVKHTTEEGMFIGKV